MRIAVFAQTGQPLYNVLVLFAAKSLGLKVIYAMDDLSPEYVGLRYHLGKASPMLTAFLLLEKLICASSDIVVVVSKSMANALSRSSPKNIVVIYNAVILHDLSPPKAGMSTTPFKLPPGFRVVYFGRIGKVWGGLEEAVFAMTMLDNGFSMTIIGEGDAKKSLQSLVSKLGLTDRVVITGPFPTESLYSILRECDLVYIAGMTDWEGHRIATPTKLFEAIALGKPIVCPDTPGLREVLNDLGTAYYYSGTPESIAAAIKRAYVDLSVATARPPKENLDLDKILDRYRDLWPFKQALSELLS